MIDSGATYSYIDREFAKKLSIPFNESSINSVITFGNNKVNTHGQVILKMKIANKLIEQEFGILDFYNTNHNIILGIDFLKREAVNINLQSRVIRIGKKDSENYLLHVNYNNEIDEVRHNNIPVYAMKNCEIRGNCIQPIAIDKSLLCKESGYYFEGNNDNHLQHFCGIINKETEEILTENNFERGRKIKKGQLLGHVFNSSRGRGGYR